MRSVHALALAAVLLAAGCAADVDPRAEPVGIPQAPDALAGVGIEDAEEVERNATSVTLLWSGGLAATVVAPEAGRIMPRGVAETTLTPPIGAFFTISSEGTAEVPISMSVRDAKDVFMCAAPADGTPCLLMARVDDVTRAPWSVRALADASTAPDAPFKMRITVRLVAPANGGLPALAADAPEPTRRWLAPTMVGDMPLHEPAIEIAPDGTIHVSGYGNEPGILWRSNDGGATFSRVPITPAPYCNAPDGLDPLAEVLAPDEGAFHVGCGDIDLAVSGNDHVYFANHWSGEAVHASHDGGATWTTSLAASAEPARTDRAWLAADGMNAWLAFNSGRQDVFPGDIVGRTVVSRTIDGGVTWAQVGQTIGWCLPGGFVHSPTDGALYLATCDDGGVAVSTSLDGGLTWDWRRVAERDGEHDRICYVCGIMIALDVDDAGNLYVAWSDPSEGTFDIWLSTSRDGAATWSAPARVNSVNGAHVMPWIAAGREGHVAVAWYASASQMDAQQASDAVWYPHVAESWNALDASPTWEEQAVTATPVQYGPICLGGAATCEEGRNLGDYLQVALDPEERPVIVYADGRLGGTWNEATRVMLATTRE